MSAHQDGLFAQGLRAYVSAVARAMRVEPEAAWCEVAEWSTAYVAVRERSLAHPAQDVMLLWDERTGWVIALEPKAHEQLVILARVADGFVPAPAVVARAVSVALSDGGASNTGVVTGMVESGHVRAQILAYALPVFTEQVFRVPRTA